MNTEDFYQKAKYNELADVPNRYRFLERIITNINQNRYTEFIM